MPLQPKKSKKSYTKVTKSGGKAETTEKAVKDARAGKGAFGAPAAYSGREHRSPQGALGGVTLQSGEYVRTTGPVQRKAALKKVEYEKKVHAERSKQKEQRNQRFKSAERKPNS